MTLACPTLFPWLLKKHPSQFQSTFHMVSRSPGTRVLTHAWIKTIGETCFVEVFINNVVQHGKPSCGKHIYCENLWIQLYRPISAAHTLRAGGLFVPEVIGAAVILSGLFVTPAWWGASRHGTVSPPEWIPKFDRVPWLWSRSRRSRRATREPPPALPSRVCQPGGGDSGHVIRPAPIIGGGLTI